MHSLYLVRLRHPRYIEPRLHDYVTQEGES